MTGAQSQPEDNRQHVRVFIMDDVDFYIVLLKAYLEAQADIRVIGTAYASEEGLAQLIKAGPDIAVVTPMMAELIFSDTIRRVRAALPNTGIVVLTFDDAAHFRQLAQEAGADTYVTKYTAPSELIPLIRELVQRR